MQNDPFLTIKQNFHMCQFSHFAVLKYNIILKNYKKFTRHANAGVLSDTIQTSAVILARVWRALVYVLFTAWARVASNTVTGEGTISVHTLPTVLTGVGACW